MIELLQTKLQLCAMLAQVGQLQIQLAQLQAEKLQRELAEAQSEKPPGAPAA